MKTGDLSYEENKSGLLTQKNGFALGVAHRQTGVHPPCGLHVGRGRGLVTALGGACK